MASTESSNTTTDDPLSAGGAALGRRDWAQAREHYARALAAGESAEALEGLAVASWWSDDVDAAITARERAFVLRREAGQTREAAWDAGFLAWDYGAMRGVSAVANGWLQRAKRLVAGLEPSVEHAWLPLIEASFHLDTDVGAVLRLSTEAAERAHALGGLDIEMTARTLQGLALVSLGRVPEGTALLDEGTAAATAGELHDPIAIGSCCCNMIIACERSRDFDRAGQWCEQLEAFCERTGQRPLLALCRAHHGTVLMMRGDWPGAEAELAWAAGELSTLRPPLAGYARARLAQLRRRQGRNAEARTLVEQAGAHVLGRLVQAEIALDEDDVPAALAHAERYLRGCLGGEESIERAAALELLVPIAIALGEPDRARAAHEQLAAVADAVPTDALRAAERCAAGRIAAADGDLGTARPAFEDAIDLHTRSAAPFDAAVVELELARVLEAGERVATAHEHALAAQTTLRGLGAATAAARADRLIAGLGRRSAAEQRGGMTVREVEVLRLVAQGRSNRQVAEELVVSEHTVHRHMANIYARLGVSSRAAAVARAAEQGLLR